jgi:nucleotide-binding universal stress UspA family protein
VSAIRKILVPTDFSPASDEAIDVALSIAKLASAEILLQHVYQLPTYAFPDGVVVATPDVMGDILSSIKRHMDAAEGRVRAAGVKVSKVTDEGAAWSEIVRRAEKEKYDLIVMGTHGRAGLAHLFLGSVAERVIRKAPCPVVTVRPRA